MRHMYNKHYSLYISNSNLPGWPVVLFAKSVSLQAGPQENWRQTSSRTGRGQVQCTSAGFACIHPSFCLSLHFSFPWGKPLCCSLSVWFRGAHELDVPLAVYFSLKTVVNTGIVGIQANHRNTSPKTSVWLGGRGSLSPEVLEKVDFKPRATGTLLCEGSPLIR